MSINIPGASEEADSGNDDDVRIVPLPPTSPRQPRCPVVVEPVIILSTFFTLISMLLSQLYVLKKFTEELNPVNISLSNNDSDKVSPCTANHSDPGYILQEAAQAKASLFNVISSVTSGVPALFVALFLGAYSDKVGRKYAILPPLVGALIRSLGYVIVMAFDAPLWYLLISNFMEGCTGSILVMFNGCFSYIADTTTQERRMFRITLLELCIYTAAIFGPIGATQWLSETGYLIPFLIIALGYVVTVLYVIFLVPETVIKDPTARMFSTSHLKSSILLFRSDNGSKRQWKLLLLLTVFFLCAVPALGGHIDTLFLKNQPLCWSDQQLGRFATVSISLAVVGGVVLAKLCKCCLSDAHIALIIGFMAVVSRVYKAFVRTTLMMFFVPVLELGSVIFIPTIRTLMSKLVESNEQGKVFGVIAFVETLCGIFGAVMFNAIYSASLSWWTGFVYLSMALFYLAASISLAIYVVKSKREDKSGSKYKQLDASEQASSLTTGSD